MYTCFIFVHFFEHIKCSRDTRLINNSFCDLSRTWCALFWFIKFFQKFHVQNFYSGPYSRPDLPQYIFFEFYLFVFLVLDLVLVRTTQGVTLGLYELLHLSLMLISYFIIIFQDLTLISKDNMVKQSYQSSYIF